MFYRLIRPHFQACIIKISNGSSLTVSNKQLSTKYAVLRSKKELPCPPTKKELPCEPTKSSTTTSGTSSTSPGNRPTRQEPGPVRLGFVPDEWMMFFHKKTGTSGLGTLFFTVMITLMSKEYYVLEHEYYGGLSLFILCVLSARYVGPEIAKYIDREIDEYEENWKEVTDHSRQQLEEVVAHELKQQLSMEGQLMLVEAKRENVALQREGAYRERLMTAYLETKRRLDFCAQREAAEKAMAKRFMTQWVVEQVKSSITKDVEDKSLNKCFEDLKVLAETFEYLKAAYDPEDTESKSKKPKPPGGPKKGKK